MAEAAVKQTPTDAMIATLDMPQGGWSDAARRDALARVQAMGLPGRRDEYWKYTRPDTLVQAQAVPAALRDGDDTVLFDAVDRLKIVFVDGVFDANASDDLTLEGITIERLADATSDLHWGRDLYGVLENNGQNPVPRPLAALNTAFAADGVLIHVTGKPSKPVNIIYRRTSTTADAMLHHCIKLDAGAELTLLENGPVAARFNGVLEVEVADKAAFHHVRAQGRDHEQRAATHIFARLGTESTFKSFTLTANGVMTRNDCVIELTGDDAAAHVAGACVGDGRDFHHDDTVFITHDAVNCESRQVFKKVLRNGATGVFQGKILVKEGAQKTDGYQISQSLLLDDDSQFLAKPELEIYADDVACSHGSTSGAIDEDALFYLRSRGVPHSTATDLLTLAFLAEAVLEVEDEDLREEVTGRLASWLERHAA
ncbi:Iron-regulated ABC transporter permease protein SufD [Sulfitobacter marinus]|uniref:Iron-regulated ABC transporter permease protein SufD n=1 Tax=Sulfitobacter marinus TaxID=394264 RepID=A0A1I6QC09_9RHOB|nr:SufD family Fe-S cluster assembly protein [Sulfitobacter marinus]SFS49942.1 Iron-regulated ABC transporter permease protein SufD [Sulfitobacter marinus]